MLAHDCVGSMAWDSLVYLRTGPNASFMFDAMTECGAWPCANQISRRLLDSVAVPVPYCSTELARPHHQPKNYRVHPMYG